MSKNLVDLATRRRQALARHAATVAGPTSSHRSARRLRMMGSVILGGGIAAACLTYWLQTRRVEPTMEELMPGYSRANSRQMGILYGQAGVVMWDCLEALRRPGVQALLIVGLSGFVAIGCFRAAWLEGDDGVQP